MSAIPIGILGPLFRRQPSSSRAQGRTSWKVIGRLPLVVLVTLSVGACESETLVFAPQIAVSRDSASRLEVLIFACDPNEMIKARLYIDPDAEPDSGDETIIWSLEGVAVNSGLIKIPFGSLPPGFREVVPYKDHLDPNEEYAVDLPSQGMTFTPSEVANGTILREGKTVTESQFVAHARSRC